MIDGNNVATWNFTPSDYTSMGIPPGDYTFTYCVVSGAEKETFTINVTLPDPCDPPTSFSVADFVDQSYTLSDVGQEYTHPAVTIEPDFCTFDPVYTETMFTDENGDMATAITQLG